MLIGGIVSGAATIAAVLGSATSSALFLGLDAGGTATRWALADAAGAIAAQGTVAPVSGLMLLDAPGRAALDAALAELAEALRPRVAPPALRAAWAGVTGFDGEQSAAFVPRLAAALGLAPAAVTLATDIELACRAAFAPGEGLVVYAGTGSIAAHLAADGRLQRAGGRGAVLDDAGGGHWIAREALKRVWRAEDAQPGAWRGSPMARALFEAMGDTAGGDWAVTRSFVYGASRGELGRLALAVARAAADDPAALALLQEAGTELARLALALRGRLGSLPVALAGRVFELHPAVEAALRAALPGVAIHRSTEPAHEAAARLAASTMNKETP